MRRSTMKAALDFERGVTLGDRYTLHPTFRRASIEGMHASRDAVCAENDGLHVRIAALEHALREVLSTAPEGGARWVVAMARARKVLEGGER